MQWTGQNQELEAKIMNQSVCISVDLGGTLIKLAYSQVPSKNKNQTPYQAKNFFPSQPQSGDQQNNSLDVKFIKFLSYNEFQTFFLKYFIGKFQKVKISATGGGAFKHRDQLKKLQNDHTKIDTNANQWEAIIAALQFFQGNPQVRIYQSKNNLISHPFLSIQYNQGESTKLIVKEANKIQTPFIIANVGSGVSFLKIYTQDDQMKFQRIGGTSLGGGYFGGLAKFISGRNFDFEELQGGLNQQGNILDRALQTSTNNLLQIMELYCRVHKAKNGLFLGNFCQIERVKKTVEKRLVDKQMKDLSIYFSNYNGYLGVFGLQTILTKNIESK